MAEPNRELADFLRRARSAVDPVRAGLPADGRPRRVRGLRREEVARLAGVSADYYTRLEQGRRITPSAGVLEAIARVLELDDASRRHLDDLVGRVSAQPGRPHPVQRVRPGLHQLLDSLDKHPALILGRHGDVLASNRLARLLFADFDRMPARERNYNRWILLDPAARELFTDWGAQARAAVESLRLEAGRDPDDGEAAALIAELTARSPEFREWWAEHRVFQRSFGSKCLRHPIAGALTVDFETLTMPGDGEQTLYLYSAEPGSSSARALAALAARAAPQAAMLPRDGKLRPMER
jgi:transcriptional regulator with XRE-family HTH domain